ncbi:hypothetical protein QBC39DRAFT_121580 [Podospora conica]|nr:hypothetical protein QBC39DRAFT_121580 [Schizothecium conicum]
MRQSSIFVALSAVTVAVAQNQNFTIDVTAVDASKRSQWCNAQFNSCGILCGQAFEDNECNPVDLKYTCTCNNGTAPGLDYYKETMPFFICQTAYAECNEKATGDSIGQHKCKTDIQGKCGTLDPSKADIKAPGSEEPSTTAATPSATGGSQAGAGDNAPAPTSSSAAGPTMIAQIGNGLAVMAAGVFAAALL